MKPNRLISSLKVELPFFTEGILLHVDFLLFQISSDPELRKNIFQYHLVARSGGKKFKKLDKKGRLTHAKLLQVDVSQILEIGMMKTIHQNPPIV